ncbi:TPA: alpha/beta hydrolase [Legionella pneumophila]|nr:alpha/beta hydrolase [Legionella pneumophila]HAU0298304.1 alpha/beta hydrolase [Legionella pneumophila]
MKTNSSAPTSYIALKEGRRLGFAEYGDKNGFPILFFHGLPGSRFEAGKLHLAALKVQVRLIGLDRPGMGLSSPQKNRTLLDWPEDIKEFATVLNLENLSIIGHSGGAPYVAACAYRIPEKLHKAVIVSGMAPLTHPKAISSLSKSQKQMTWMIRYFPMILKFMMKMSCKSLENPNQLRKMLKQLPEVDAKIFENSDNKKSMVLSLKEAFRQNTSGVVEDFKLLLKPWGFDLEEIQCPFVVWQGGNDKQAPVKHAEIYAQQIPEAEYVLLEKEGHISLLYNYGEQILISALQGSIS